MMKPRPICAFHINIGNYSVSKAREVLSRVTNLIDDAGIRKEYYVIILPIKQNDSYVKVFYPGYLEEKDDENMEGFKTLLDENTRMFKESN